MSTDHLVFAHRQGGNVFRRDATFCEDIPTVDDTSRTTLIEASFKVSTNEQANSLPHCVNTILVLEERIKKMEAHLIQEQEKRLTLEKRVAMLETENEKLSALRTTAATQLQLFSEKFFSFSEPLRTSTPDIAAISTPPLSASPLSNHSERTADHFNHKSHNRLSLQSMKSLTARYSNISL